MVPVKKIFMLLVLAGFVMAATVGCGDSGGSKPPAVPPAKTDKDKMPEKDKKP